MGSERVLDSDNAQKRYGPSTLGGTERAILGGLLPETAGEVVALVKIAAKNGIPLYPISTGNNWGYGSASPVVDACVVVDLSRMNKIIDVDRKLGLATIEPGVTSGQLMEYIEKRHIPFIAPRTGAGPQCSIIGNILERGRSINPYIDRFASIMALEAVLADGTLYASSSEGRGKRQAFFKWGVGPYIDGLFGQSNFGITVRMTIALAPKPERVEHFLISLEEGTSLSSAVEQVRESLHKLGTNITSIKIEMPHRVLAKMERYPASGTAENSAFSPEYLQRSLRSLSLTKLTVIGTVQGEREIVKAARTALRRRFGSSAKRIFFFTAATFRALAVIAASIPVLISLKKLIAAIRLLHTFPEARFAEIRKEKTISLSWKAENDLASDTDSDQRRGLLFFSAVLPMLGERVETFVVGAEEICKKHRFKPIIGLLNFSDRCMYVPIQLIFDKSNAQEVTSSRHCYAELSQLAIISDGYVYRGTIASARGMAHDEKSFWETAQMIKKALDPRNIIAPGRYSNVAPLSGEKPSAQKEKPDTCRAGL